MAKKNDDTPAADTPAAEPIAPATDTPAVDAAAADALPVYKAEPIAAIVSEEPKNSEYSGRYTRRGNDEKFALAIRENARDGRTHFLKNTLHFINITEADFRLQFDEVKEKKA